MVEGEAREGLRLVSALRRLDVGEGFGYYEWLRL